MKIIFDSEEQKERFMNTVVSDYCPSLFGAFPNMGSQLCDIYDCCKKCWEQSGIDMEVVNAVDNSK